MYLKLEHEENIFQIYLEYILIGQTYSLIIYIKKKKSIASYLMSKVISEYFYRYNTICPNCFMGKEINTLGIGAIIFKSHFNRKRVEILTSVRQIDSVFLAKHIK